MATEQIDSFDDLLGLLERETEYRARRRQLILDEEFQQLPAAVRAQSERFDALTEQVRQLTAKMRDVVIRLDQHDVQLARLIGDEAERRVQRNAHAYFGNMLRRIRVISPSELADMIDDAIDAGSLDDGERAPLLALDVVVRGLDRRTRERAYLAVEVSAGIGERDIIRAVNRARLLERLTGHPTRPVVSGYSIAPAYHYMAAEQGVAVTMVAPPDPGEPELPTDIKVEPPP